jgi:hypothetical protein
MALRSTRTDRQLDISKRSVIKFLIATLGLLTPIIGTFMWVFYVGWPSGPSTSLDASPQKRSLFYGLLVLYTVMSLSLRLRYHTPVVKTATMSALVGVAFSLAIVVSYVILWWLIGFTDTHQN